jgi:hypothetical protein
VIGTAADTTNNCNFSTATGCTGGSTPSIGTFSFTVLDFVQTKSCALGDHRGETCNSNDDCADGTTPLTPCLTCGPSSEVFFYKNPAASANRGTGNLVIENCSSGITYNTIQWGTSEAIPGSGGGCLGLQSDGDSKTGSPCGVTTSLSSQVDLTLYVDALGGTCNIDAGDIPNINLDGRVISASAAAPAGTVCGYTQAQQDILRGLAGNTGYLMIACDSQTLPSPLAAACISGADYDSVIVLKTTQNASDCPDCGGGCVAATAEDAE